MKLRLCHAIAAALAAGATSLAFAQAAPQSTQATLADFQPAEPTSAPAVTPAWTPSQPLAPSTMTFVQEPVASLSKTDGADAEIAKSIADALNAEPTMKNSKITVQPDNGTFTLTGVVPTREQVKKAGEIAKQMAGEALVINAILDSQT
jgi:hypothetical protein